MSRKKKCQECMIAPLEHRRNAHLLSSMHKQTNDTQVLPGCFARINKMFKKILKKSLKEKESEH